jgi:hypothetical protein
VVHPPPPWLDPRDATAAKKSFLLCSCGWILLVTRPHSGVLQFEQRVLGMSDEVPSKEHEEGGRGTGDEVRGVEELGGCSDIKEPRV